MRARLALIAHLRQEFTAPASAIVGYVDILIEDAGRLSLDDYLADLERIRAAGQSLYALLQSVLSQDEATVIDQVKLRHDLRTPINAIKGYGEMLAEDAAGQGHASLAADLDNLLNAASGMLKRIDALVNFASLPPAEMDVRPVSGMEGIREALKSIHSVAASASADIKGRILIVDDNESNRNLLGRQLVRLGHVVQESKDGLSALSQLKSEEFDLVLLDLMMPDISGYEVLRRIKDKPKTRDIPIIMISALDDMDSVIRCIEAGAVDYLFKPFDPTLLRARIGASLEVKLLRDREKVILEEIRREKARSEDLLLSILPRAVVERINAGETMIADQVDEVTILFADIVGFTRMGSRFSAANLVDMLNRIFSRFDDLATQYGAEKIKTIGDAYMAAFGLPKPHEDQQGAAASLALAMLDEIGRLRTPEGHALAVRIGIHTGPAVAGVIGHHKFSFDVWGATVNLASRMESHGEPGKVHVSAAFAASLAGRFTFTDRGTIDVKGAGPIATFFLDGPAG